MQSVSVGFSIACLATNRLPSYRLYIKWDGTNWVNETQYLEPGWSGQLTIAGGPENLVAPGSVGELRFRLNNFSGRFSQNDVTSPIHGYIAGAGGMSYKEVKLQVGFSNEYCTIFTGVISSHDEDTVGGAVSIVCNDMGYKYLQDKVSTPMLTNKLTSEWITYLAQSVAGIAAENVIVDTALTRIPWAWADDESVVEEMWRAAEAEGGRCYFDQNGYLRFETATHWLLHTNVWNFDGNDFETLTPQYSAAQLASKIICEYSPRYPGDIAELYSLDRVRTIRPGETIELEARFNAPAINIIQPDPQQHKDYYIASGAGTDLTTVCTVTLSEVNGQRANIANKNNSAIETAVVFRFSLRGQPLVGAPSNQVTVTNASPFKRTRSARNNPYVQTDPQARIVATMLAEKMERLTPVYPLAGVPGVPQLELGDFVSVGEPNTGVGINGWVVTIRFREDGGAFVQDVDVLEASDPNYIRNDYFVIGRDTLGTGNVCWH